MILWRRGLSGILNSAMIIPDFAFRSAGPCFKTTLQPLALTRNSPVLYMGSSMSRSAMLRWMVCFTLTDAGVRGSLDPGERYASVARSSAARHLSLTQSWAPKWSGIRLRTEERCTFIHPKTCVQTRTTAILWVPCGAYTWNSLSAFMWIQLSLINLPTLDNSPPMSCSSTWVISRSMIHQRSYHMDKRQLLRTMR